MARAGDTLDISQLGFRVLLKRTAAETDGAELELEVSGRPRGFITQEHVHPSQLERHEMIDGSMKLVLDGQDHILMPGDAIEVPAGAPHRQLPLGEGDGRDRVILRPAGSTQEFLERLAELSASGAFNRFGLPKPVAGAELVRGFGEGGHASRPSLGAQQAIAGLVLKVAAAFGGAAGSAEAHGGPHAPYLFVDEWDVAAPQEAVFVALADSRTYPEWWRPVYIGVEGDQPPALGVESTQHFKGRLPYHLRTRGRIVEFDPPHLVRAEVEGDLRGIGVWTLTPIDGGTHVRFDWQVHADRPLLRRLTPLLRPLFRWNHNWAIARAMEGLEPYAARHARQAEQAPISG
jgi:uncharacterized protein YndB with AHSA1/START domain